MPGAQQDIRLLIVQYFGKALNQDEKDVRDAIQNPTKAVQNLAGGSKSPASKSSTSTASSSTGSGQTASTSTEAYAVQYVVGKWTTDNQLATSVLKSMNDAFSATARNT